VCTTERMSICCKMWYCMDVCEQLPPEEYRVADDHTTFCWLQHEMAPETDLKKATAKKGEV
ncbi:MAG: hypothetical protein ACLVFF_09140, partial [Coprococcus comes]